jgi:WD40 repeat protein
LKFISFCSSLKVLFKKLGLHIVTTLEGLGSQEFTPIALNQTDLLATGSHDGIVRIWNTTSGHLEKLLEGHEERVNTVAFSHDNFLASGSDDKTVLIWSTVTGQLVKRLRGHNEKVNAVAFNHGNLFVSGCSRGRVRLVRTDTWKLIEEFRKVICFLGLWGFLFLWKVGWGKSLKCVTSKNNSNTSVKIEPKKEIALKLRGCKIEKKLKIRIKIE